VFQASGGNLKKAPLSQEPLLAPGILVPQGCDYIGGLYEIRNKNSTYLYHFSPIAGFIRSNEPGANQATAGSSR
jgi:hypothetical protein